MLIPTCVQSNNFLRPDTSYKLIIVLNASWYHVTAVHVVVDEERVEKLQVDWEHWQKQIAADEQAHLLIIESPYRSLLRPLLAYVDALRQRHPQETLTVILPEYVVAHWWEYFLHNQIALRLKAALLFRPRVAVLNLPQHLSSRVS